MPFARVLAAKLYARRTYAELEFMDYYQFASIGLVEAVDRFDPEMGVKFETYAASRINGAVLTGIETLSERQVQVSARQRMMTERVASLKEHGEPPSDAKGLFSYLAEIAIGLAVGFVMEESDSAPAAAPSYADNTYVHVEFRQMRERLMTLLDELPLNEQRVTKYHYLQQFSFEEIASVLGVTKGRVSQIHKSALGRLKANASRTGALDLSF